MTGNEFAAGGRTNCSVTTRSPRLRALTPDPIAATTPEGLTPSTCGSFTDRVRPGPQDEVERAVHRHGADLDEHLIRLRHGRRHLFEAHHLGRPEFADDHRLHRAILSFALPAKGRCSGSGLRTGPLEFSSERA